MSPPRFEDEEGPTVHLEELTCLEFDTPRHERSGDSPTHEVAHMNEILYQGAMNEVNLPKSHLVIVAETETLKSGEETELKDAAPSDVAPILAALTDTEFEFSKMRVHDWDGTKFFSDYIAEGIKQKEGLHNAQVVMLFDSPSSYETPDNLTFCNKDKFRFHDWPHPLSNVAKITLGPCRYALMNGASFPVFLRNGEAPNGLIDHWKKYVPGFVEPAFVDVIKEEDTVYAYLPVEKIKNHVNDPHLHYHLAGKDSIVLMTQKTTRLLPDTKTIRPCVAKTTHSMASKGIFIIQNDEDEKELEDYLAISGNPTFIVTDFVDIQRNIACHFFIHPSGDVTWFGSNENKRFPDGRFSTDSYLVMEDQQSMKRMQLPFVMEVVQYCNSLGFWGFCGVDVLFDSLGRGYLVDINPRVTGSCPALMTLHLLNKKYGFTQGMFRRSGAIVHNGTYEQLIAKVDLYNEEHQGKSILILHSFVIPPVPDKPVTKVNMGCFGFDMDECLAAINSLVALPSDGDDF